MTKRIDEKGNVYGRLTVIGLSGRHNDGRAMWSCECTCGNRVDVDGRRLRNGDTRSCGCRRHEPRRRSIFSRVNYLDFIDDDILAGA
jgi:hypothetical protein